MSGARRRAAPRDARAAPAASVSVLGARRFQGLPARSTLVRWVRLALQHRARITLVLADARHARALNRHYRQHDYATNVLTFAYELKPQVLADVVLCVPVARREARDQGKTMRAHLAHLLIHGVLHAQGYDHVRPDQARLMQNLEIEYLERLRISNPYL